MERSINRPGIDNEKVNLLNAVLKTNKKHVMTAFAGLNTIQDSFYLGKTIYEAEANLIRTNQEISSNKYITLDPWAQIYQHEASKKEGAPAGNPHERIIEKGFQIDFTPKHKQVNSEESYEVASLGSTLEEILFKLEIEETKLKTQKKKLFESGLDTNHPLIKKLMDHIVIHLPSFRNKFTSLQNDLPDPADHIQFDKLLAYKNRILSRLGNYDNYIAGLKNINSIYWSQSDDAKEAENKSTSYAKSGLGFKGGIDINPNKPSGGQGLGWGEQPVEKGADIPKKEEIETDIASQLKGIDEDTEQYKKLKNKLTQQLHVTAIKIQSDCEELAGQLNKENGLLLKYQLENELQKCSDMAANFRTVEVNRKGKNYILSTDDLTKIEFLDCIENIKTNFGNLQEQIVSLKKAILTFIDIDFKGHQDRVSMIERNLIQISGKIYPSFYIDKINKLLENYQGATKELQRFAASKSSKDIMNFIKAGEKAESDLQALNTYCDSLKKAKILDPIEQLQAGIESGFLRTESELVIRNALKDWASTQLDKIINQIKEYKSSTEVLPEELENKIASIIETKITNRKALKDKSFDIMSPENLHKLCAKIEKAL
ncbi:MAG TPA: hypothetical protein VGP47_10165, partial [Parachlamydiaceae bacterium]|nr:hypothetical protein [Parachlamydiaceae bacterium]